MQTSRTRRLTAIVLAFAVVLSCLFVGGSPASVKAVGTGKIADASTIPDYEALFGLDVKDTHNAGRIWADKTVSAENIQLYNEDGSSMTNGLISLQNQDDFLIGLSALSSNKSIVGQDTIPIDVMLVLDVSGSMSSKTTSTMVTSVNSAIEDLQSLNPHNRVGVVLFSSDWEQSYNGNSSVLLPLGRYSKSWGNYIDYNSSYNDNNGLVSVGSSVRIEGTDQKPQSTSRIAKGGTYTQHGVLNGWDQLKNAGDKEIDGKSKIPIMVLMSDGAPTEGRNAYTTLGNNTFGDGQSSGTKYAFVNQLTMAWVKNQMETEYGREPLLYTLGYGFNSLSDNQQRPARMVLDPGNNTNDTLDSYWRGFDGLSENQSGSIGPQGDKINIIKADTTISNADRNYVNEYFSAENDAGLTEAFKQIIEEIYIQSMYYPTDVEGNGASLSGYMTFRDPLGSLMEVKKMHGLVYNDKVYTGSAFAKAIRDAQNAGDGSEAQLYFDEMSRSLQQRLNISVTDVKNLITTAWQDGQLYYNSDTDFGASFKWYSTADGTYIAPWSSTDTAENKPVNATHINESFLFSGEYKTEVGEGVEIKTDLMYISTRVSTNIETGEQTVFFAIPASLIPQVQYKVTVPGNTLEDAKTSELERVSAYPMRLFYEVGLQEGIENNIEYLAEGKTDVTYYPETDTYKLYTNSWDSTTKEADTTVTFDPSQENEFYYYHKNTVITDVNGNPITGSLDKNAATGTYYYKHEVFSTAAGSQPIDWRMEEITNTALQKAVQNTTDGTWYIPKGTPKRQDEITEVVKQNNVTGTADYVRNPVLTGTDILNEFHVEGRLGNNGAVTIQQNRGSLEISKDVTGNRGETDLPFEFGLTFTQPNGSPLENPAADSPNQYTYSVTRKDGTAETGTMTLNDAGVATFTKAGETTGSALTLKDTETITINNLPVGANFTVTEADPNANSTKGYTTTMKVNGVEYTATAARVVTGTIVKDADTVTTGAQPTTVDYTNDWTVPYAPFSFTKVDGTVAEGDPAVPLAGAEFRLFECTTVGHDHSNELIALDELDSTTDCWADVKTVTSDENGDVNFGDLPAGTYRLVETKAPDGFQLPKGQWNVTIIVGSAADGTVNGATIAGVENPPAFAGNYTDGYSVENYKPIDPPITGGDGGFIFLIAGALLLIGSGFFFFYRRTARNRF